MSEEAEMAYQIGWWFGLFSGVAAWCVVRLFLWWADYLVTKKAPKDL